MKSKKKWYLHCSCIGSYYISCVVRGKFKNKRIIEYIDPITETKEIEFVDKNLIKSKMPK